MMESYLDTKGQASGQSSAILVIGLPEGITGQKITIHFQKKSNGGGDVTSVQYPFKKIPVPNAALVTFAKHEVMETIFKHKQEVQGTLVTVLSFPMVLKEVQAVVDPQIAAILFGDEKNGNTAIQNLQKECCVEVKQEAGAVGVIGNWFQVQNAEKYLFSRYIQRILSTPLRESAKIEGALKSQQENPNGASLDEKHFQPGHEAEVSQGGKHGSNALECQAHYSRDNMQGNILPKDEVYIQNTVTQNQYHAAHGEQRHLDFSSDAFEHEGKQPEPPEHLDAKDEESGHQCEPNVDNMVVIDGLNAETHTYVMWRYQKKLPTNDGACIQSRGSQDENFQVVISAKSKECLEEVSDAYVDCYQRTYGSIKIGKVEAVCTKEEGGNFVQALMQNSDDVIITHDHDSHCFTIVAPLDKIEHLKRKIEDQVQEIRLGRQQVPRDACSLKTKRGLLIHIYKGDITNTNVTAIVNAANDKLQHGGGVAKAIRDAAGKDFDSECQSELKKRGSFGVTEVLYTTNGGQGAHLSCQYVIHAVGPRWSDYNDKEMCIMELRWTFYNCLTCAEDPSRIGGTSVAIPAISAGIFGVPKEKVSQALLEAVLDFDRERQQNSALREIHLVNISHDMTELIRRRFTKNGLRYGLKAFNPVNVAAQYIGIEIGEEATEVRRSNNPYYGLDEKKKTHRNKLDLSEEKASNETQKESDPINGNVQVAAYSPHLPKTYDSMKDAEEKSGIERREEPMEIDQSNIPPASYHRLDKRENESQQFPVSTGDNDDPNGTQPESAATTENPEGATARASDAGISAEDICVICMDPINNPKRLEKCGHTFCTRCIDDSFKLNKPACPTCGAIYGVLKGNQPPGSMTESIFPFSLPGYEQYGTIKITYRFHDGYQKEEHPNPGARYYGTFRDAYLPDSTEGKKVLRLLRKAFNNKLVFTIGRSTTTGREGQVTWNDIHHKTNIRGGPIKFGYPDPDYLRRVQDELKAKGIQEEQDERKAYSDPTKKYADSGKYHDITAVPLPKHWSTMPPSQDVKIIELKQGDSDYKDVVGSIHETFRGTKPRIEQIWRIQNPKLFQTYMAYKRHMKENCAQNKTIQSTLWHGTSEGNYPKISKRGLSCTFNSHIGRHGTGLYFSVNAGDCMNVCRASYPSGSKWMIRCRVLTGEYCKSESWSHYAPSRSSSGGKFDSVVDKVSNPSVFVIFSDNQAYPEYVVKFRN